MNSIVRSIFWGIVGVLLLTALPAHGSKDCVVEMSRTPEYETLPDWFLKVFVAEDPIYIILIEKERQLLRLMRHGSKLEVVAEYPCATGEVAGKKMFSGDSRTPEGIYFVTKSYKDKNITIFGNRAFHLDFPNIFDKNSGIKGNGIYIHGTNKELKRKSTNGCIVLRNKDLDDLAEFLKMEDTPVVIVSSLKAIRGVEPEEAGIERLNSAKTLLLPEGIEREKAKFRSLCLITDADQTVIMGKYSLCEDDCLRTRVYITPDEEEGWINAGRIHNGKVLTGGRLLPQYPRDKEALLEFVEVWRDAWQSKNLEAYMDCYHKSFKHGRMNWSAYATYKKRLNKKYRFIKVHISEVSVRWTATGAKVSFHQVYQSDRYRAAGRKTLYLTFKGKRWGIEREVWLRTRPIKRAAP